MGNKESTIDPKQTVQHEKLGPIRVFQVQQKNEEGDLEQIQKMEITRNILEKQKYQKWASELKKIDDDQGLELFLVPQQHSFEKAGFCGGSGLVKLVYNKFQFLLSSEIKNRLNLSKYFEETEVWYVLYNLVRAGNKFELLKQKIGDIHPNNILINEDGQTAIICRYSIPDEPDNFHRYLEDRKADVFLAPEQMKLEDIEKGSYNQNVDKCLAEVFSIGLTVLSAGTLEHCNDVYQREPFKINTQRLSVLIDQFAKSYSPYLTQILRSMLQLNPEKRVRSKQLYEILLRYEQQILDLQPFNPPNSVGVNQHTAGGYYNQPYQGYQQGYSQPVQGYQYPSLGGGVVNAPISSQYGQNVRWNEHTNMAGSYNRR